MRYDAALSHHHHLYCAETDRIEDYEDEKLNKIISEYFENNKIYCAFVDYYGLHQIDSYKYGMAIFNSDGSYDINNPNYFVSYA